MYQRLRRLAGQGIWFFSSEKHRTVSSESAVSGVFEARRSRKLALNLFGTSFLGAAATAALLFALMLGPITLGGCHEEPSEKECEAAAKKRARYFFGAGKEKDTGSARQTKRSEKLEFEASMDDCKKGWSKRKAICVAESKNRNMMISCK